MEVFKAKALRQGSFNAQRSLEPNLKFIEISLESSPGYVGRSLWTATWAPAARASRCEVKRCERACISPTTAKTSMIDPLCRRTYSRFWSTPWQSYWADHESALWLHKIIRTARETEVVISWEACKRLGSVKTSWEGSTLLAPRYQQRDDGGDEEGKTKRKHKKKPSLVIPQQQDQHALTLWAFIHAYWHIYTHIYIYIYISHTLEVTHHLKWGGSKNWRMLTLSVCKLFTNLLKGGQPLGDSRSEASYRY